MNRNSKVTVIGAGLAGSEAALVLASAGIGVDLYEMRPGMMTPAHRSGKPAELVCSNSFKSKELPNSHALLKKELEILGSPLLRTASETSVPAGSALAVDRELFSEKIDLLIQDNQLIDYYNNEVRNPDQLSGYVLIAAGPLVSDSLSKWIIRKTGGSGLHFYDAIAPVVAAESIDTEKAFFASRWGRGTPDYINAPFTKEEFDRFYSALIEADRTSARRFEDERFFEACLPIEVIASRGDKALRFGTMRPVGLNYPKSEKRPYAVCQLRRENLSGESYSIVGFQTRLKIPEQKRVFRMIPGLESAEFYRYGSIHRNTYIDSPAALNPDLSMKKESRFYICGQLSGNEGYTESIATGHMAARALLMRLMDREISIPPGTTAAGSLMRHIVTHNKKGFVPTNFNFGLIDPLEDFNKRRQGKKEKQRLLVERALEDIKEWSLNLED